MLSALLSKLQDRNVRLAQLIGEKVGHFETFGDVVSNDSLKCELIFAASSRALRCVKATMTVDEAKLLDSCSIKETRAVLHKISPANGFGMTDHSDQLLQEGVVKELLLKLCNAEDGNDCITAILWLALHVQEAPYSTKSENQEYLNHLKGCVGALQNATIQSSYQPSLEKVLKDVGEMNLNDLSYEMQHVLSTVLGLQGVDSWKANIAHFKVKAIKVSNFFLGMRVLGWSSSDTIYINSSDGTLGAVLASHADGSSDVARFILTALVARQAGYCLARARNCAIERRSGQAPERNSGVDFSDISSCACASLLGCGLETGNLVECILFGGLVDSESLWLFRRRCAFLALHNGIRVHALCPSCNSCPSSDPNKDWFERLVLRRGYLPTMGFSSRDQVKFFK